MSLSYPIIRWGRASNLIFLLLSFFMIGLVFAADERYTTAEQSFAELFPNSMTTKKYGEYYVLNFCPDNTCTEFRQKNVGNLVGNAIVYLYFFGDYYDLEKWRKLEKTQSQIDDLLTEIKLSSCPTSEASRKDCISRKLKARGLHVYYIRFDENFESRVRVW